MTPRTLFIARSALALACIGLVPAALGAGSSLWTVRSFDTEHGLPGARVFSVGQSNDGYLWVGTSEGLARFDGVRFQTTLAEVEVAPGDSDVMVLRRAGDRLFYASRAGAHGEIVDRRLVPLGAISGEPQVLAALPRGGDGLWLGGSAGGVRVAGGSQPRVLGEAHGLPPGAVTSLVEDAAGEVWALAGGQLVCWKEERWVAPTERMGGVDAIAPARGGGLWVATASGKRGGTAEEPGIWRLRNGAAVWHSALPREDPAYYSDRVGVLFEDHQDRLWCGVRGGGLFHQEAEGKWLPAGSRDMLARVSTLFEDADGVIWAGTEATGLCRITRRLVVELRAPGSIAPPVFWTACATRNGDVWGGTDGAGLFCWRKDGSVQSFGPGRGLPSGQVPCLLEDRAGTLFAGTRDGLHRFEDEKFTLAHGEVRELQTLITALHEDPRGALWVGTEGGAIEIFEGKTILHGPDSGLPAGRIRGFATDAAGVLHIAVFGQGLFRREASGAFQGILGWNAGPAIRGLVANPGGGIWVATSGRWLFRHDGTAYIRYGREEGLPNQNLQAVLTDDRGNLWCASDLGIFGASLRELQAPRLGGGAPARWWKLLGAQGLPNKAATGIGSPTAARGPDGRLWFPNGTALAGFDPASLPDSEKVRPPFIEEISIAGNLAAEPDATGWRRLPHRSALNIQFTSPDTFYPERLSFRTRLEGLDAGWVEMQEKREVSYADLAPGRYTFHVAVSAPGGPWIETAARSAHLEIVPAFWDRRSTQYAAAAAALGLVALLAWRVEYARNQRHLARVATRLALETERQRIARDLHDELGAGLTDIMFAGDNLAEDLAHAPKLQPDAERIAARARELARSIEEVVWSVDPAEDTLASFLLRFQRTAQEQLDLAGIQCRWDAPFEVPEISLPVRVRHALLMAGKETMNNAIKHAGAREVRVRVRFDEPPGGFNLVIKDDGRGFDSSVPAERGYGLGGVRSRLAECGGVCKIVTSPGEGTCVEFSIPPLALVSG